jgi:hypothetical protein
VFSIGEALLVEPRAWRILRARCFSLWLKPSPRSESAPTQAGQEAGAIPSPASTPGEPAPEDRPCPVEPAADPRVAAQPRPDFEENRRALERLLEALLARADLVVESTDQAPAVWAQAILPLVSETPAIVEPVPDAKV